MSPERVPPKWKGLISIVSYLPKLSITKPTPVKQNKHLLHSSKYIIHYYQKGYNENWNSACVRVYPDKGVATSSRLSGSSQENIYLSPLNFRPTKPASNAITETEWRTREEEARVGEPEHREEGSQREKRRQVEREWEWKACRSMYSL